MLQESTEEKGCFTGCLPYILSGVSIGGLIGYFSFAKVCTQYDMPGSVGQIVGVILGACFGLIVGGTIGVIVGRILTFIRKKDEDF